MIVVTGAAGFIGSNLVAGLNDRDERDIVAVDRFGKEKAKNLLQKQVAIRLDRDDLFAWLDENHKEVEFIFHLGARTDTMETDEKLLEVLNTGYTKTLWKKCCHYQIPLIYASSAATYGDGRLGFSDDEACIPQLRPLNAYGWSKHHFDLWALRQEEKPPFWAGLKFFNVYGPGESHKGRMASVVFHAFRQIQETGKMKLFKSHHPDFPDGGQKRDFIYAGDVINTMLMMMSDPTENGIYNVGTGQAETFLDLTRAVFKSLRMPEKIEFIDTPEQIRANYQYFTEADMTKLSAWIHHPFTPLAEGVDQTIRTMSGR